MRIKTYIINLKRSTARKQYMQNLLAGYDFLDVEFIKAIDGRALSEEELESSFNSTKSLSLYGKRLIAGEVGCVLSHRKAYETILESDDQYALVFEDDISIMRDLNSIDWESVDKVLNQNKPIALMLSGDYWYYKPRSVVKLFSAVGAYAYLINKQGAKAILSEALPCCVADDWTYYKRLGLKLYGVFPYAVDANMKMDILGSDVKQNDWGINRSKMSLEENIIGAYNGFTKKMFKLFHHFEGKVRVINNIIVD